MDELKRKIEELNYAKEAVLATLENSTRLVDMHSLGYWAERVEKLRTEIREML